MRNAHYLIAVLSLLLVACGTITMIKAKDMIEVTVSLIGMLEGVIIFFIFERIDNNIKRKQ